MKRRILAAALTVFMLLTLLPTTVFAEDPNTVTSPQDNGSAVSTEESGNVDVPEWDPSSTHYTNEHNEKVAWNEAEQLPTTQGPDPVRNPSDGRTRRTVPVRPLQRPVRP